MSDCIVGLCNFVSCYVCWEITLFIFSQEGDPDHQTVIVGHQGGTGGPLGVEIEDLQVEIGGHQDEIDRPKRTESLENLMMGKILVLQLISNKNMPIHLV